MRMALLVSAWAMRLPRRCYIARIWPLCGDLLEVCFMRANTIRQSASTLLCHCMFTRICSVILSLHVTPLTSSDQSRTLRATS